MKRVISAILFLVIAISCTGCSQNAMIEKSRLAVQSQVETYSYTGDVKYVAISYETVNDGTNGLDIIEYVDLSTGVIWIYTEKYQTGYGTTWSMAMDASNNPIIYNDLDSLRKQHGYEMK